MNWTAAEPLKKYVEKNKKIMKNDELLSELL